LDFHRYGYRCEKIDFFQNLSKSKKTFKNVFFTHFLYGKTRFWRFFLISRDFEKNRFFHIDTRIDENPKNRKKIFLYFQKIFFTEMFLVVWITTFVKTVFFGMKKKHDFYSKSRFFWIGPGINASGRRPFNRDRGKIFYTHKLQIGSNIIAKEIFNFRRIQAHFIICAVLMFTTLYVLFWFLNVYKKIIFLILRFPNGRDQKINFL